MGDESRGTQIVRGLCFAVKLTDRSSLCRELASIWIQAKKSGPPSHCSTVKVVRRTSFCSSLRQRVFGDHGTWCQMFDFAFPKSVRYEAKMKRRVLASFSLMTLCFRYKSANHGCMIPRIPIIRLKSHMSTFSFNIIHTARSSIPLLNATLLCGNHAQQSLSLI